jgi:DNA-binding NarL/FixJ family response regulator
MTPDEMRGKILFYRQKQKTPEGLSTEELMEVVDILAQGRTSAQIASTTSRTRTAAAKAPIAQSTLDDIFGALK